jgi:hypothetical protein
LEEEQAKIIALIKTEEENKRFKWYLITLDNLFLKEVESPKFYGWDICGQRAESFEPRERICY